ncbi:MAG: head GIN domain-containing protein [Patescibacteria group bacterium]
MTNEQTKGIKSILSGIAVIIIIIGAVTEVYDVMVGVIIALAIWLIGFPLLKVMGLDSKDEKIVEPVETKSITKKNIPSLWLMAVTAIGVLVVALLVSGYVWGRGSGKLVKESRAVSDFNQVVISGTGVLNIVQSGEEKLEVEAEDNIMKHLETFVENNTLKLKVKNPWFFWTIWPTKKITYNLSVDDLSRIGISGSGEIITDGTLKADELTIQISGSGKADMVLDVKNLAVNISGSGEFLMAGTATDQNIKISGSGDYNAKNMVSKNAVISISGSGDGILNATDELDVTISGSGDIQYVGSPSLTQSISGSGKIRQYAGTVDLPETNSNTNSSTGEIPSEDEYYCVAGANCFPMIGGDADWTCAPKYIEWATANCPDFHVTY